MLSAYFGVPHSETYGCGQKPWYGSFLMFLAVAIYYILWKHHETPDLGLLVLTGHSPKSADAQAKHQRPLRCDGYDATSKHLRLRARSPSAEAFARHFSAAPLVPEEASASSVLGGGVVTLQLCTRNIQDSSHHTLARHRQLQPVRLAKQVVQHDMQ